MIEFGLLTMAVLLIIGFFVRVAILAGRSYPAEMRIPAIQAAVATTLAAVFWNLHMVGVPETEIIALVSIAELCVALLKIGAIARATGTGLVALVAFALLTANVCQAQTVASQVPADRKDPSTAVMMSLVAPGGGQLYAGELVKGTLMLVGGEGALITGWSTSRRERCIHLDCSGTRWTNFYMGASAFLGIWFYSMMDAPRAARRYNAKADRTTARVEPIITSERVGAAIAF